MTAADDDLLSVYEVARMWGTGVPVVLHLLGSGQLLSIDRGLLIEQGDFHTPVIRRSWARAFQDEEVPGDNRILPPPPGAAVHPAVEPAYDFHVALQTRDAEQLHSAASRASQAGYTPQALLDKWLEVGSDLAADDAGVATNVYSLVPYDAVGVRVVVGATAMPRAVSAPAPVILLGVLPLVADPGGWRVDLALFEKGNELTQLLVESPSAISDSDPS